MRKMAELPDEVIVMILSWLPFKSLMQFQCVCKAWFSLITTDFLLLNLHSYREGTVGWYKHKLGSLSNQKADEQDSCDKFYKSYLQKALIGRLMTTLNFIDHMEGGRRRVLPIPILPLLMQQSEMGTSKYNIIHKAQPGMEKTVSFCYTILQQLDYGLLECQALVLCPTIEVVQRIEEVLHALNFFIRLKNRACGSDTSFQGDRSTLLAGVHVVVGTPNCVFDMLQQKTLRLNHIKMFIIDEADTMLSRCFTDKVFDIYLRLPFQTQVGIFSAIVIPEVLEMVGKAKGLKV